MRWIQKSVWVFLLGFFASFVCADTLPKTAEESVQQGVEAVLEVVRKYNGNQDDATRRQYLNEVSEVLSPVIGYPVIARRVMGDAYDIATRDQKIRFLAAFKRSLVNTYAGGIYAFGAYEVNLLPSQDDKKDTVRNTRVYLEVVSPEGPTYSLVQSVYFSPSSKSWKMQNAIFNGINLGVTFRTQFRQVFDDANQDMEKTIVEWERITEESFSNTTFRD